MEAWMEINGPLQLKEEIGLGAYGRVYRVEYQGAQCEGQKLHSALLEPGIEGYTVVKDSFLSECSLLMKIHHPHIMATYGVYQSSSHSPLILSELMTQTLRQLIRTSHPLHWTQHHPIMLQVTSGLCYLHHHSPPLIHRNLTSANVFLDRGGVAKIAYLGLSRLFTDSSKELSPCPGNVGYLPPEALQQSALYSPKLDVFSLGVLLLESLTGNLPAPGPLFSENPTPDRFSQAEVNRRRSDLSLIPSHPYLALITLCLAPETSRPSSLEVLQIMRTHKPPSAPMPLHSPQKQQRDEATVCTATELAWYKQEYNRITSDSSLLRDYTPSPVMSVSNITTLDNSGTSKHCQLVSLGASLYLYESATGIFHGYSGREGWRELSRCHLEQGSLCLLAGLPTVVGGWDSKENSNCILSFKRDRWAGVEAWHEVLPRMPTARQLCFTAVHKSTLFVLGGVIGNEEGGMNTVEVLSECVWRSGPSLPSPICGGYACLLSDYLYLAGGYFGILLSAESTLVLRARVSRLLCQEGIARGEVCWEKHSYTPTVHCGLGILGNSLVAVGGKGKDGKMVKEVVRYDEQRREWTHMGNLLHPCWKVGLFVCEDGIKVAGHSIQNHGHFYIDNISLVV